MPNLLLRQDRPAQAFQAQAPKSSAFVVFIALILFLLVGGAYAGLTVMNKNQVDQRDTLKAEVAQKKDDLRSSAVSEIFLTSARLKSLGSLLAGHVFATSIFGLVEAKVHPGVSYKGFGFAHGTRKVDMMGDATDYVTLARQLTILQNDPSVEQIGFGGLSLNSKGGISFNLSLILKHKLINSQTSGL